MAVVADWALVVITTLVASTAIRRIARRKSNTLADYAIVIIWAFNCLPVALDAFLGPPNYRLYPWFSYLSSAMASDQVRFVYALYVLAVVSILGAYSASRVNAVRPQPYERSGSTVFKGPVLLMIALAPVALVLVSGSLQAFLHYTSLASRVSGSMYEIIGGFELIGLFAFFCWYFERRTRPPSLVWPLLYCSTILWIDGKRYIIATMVLLALFFYMSSVWARPLVLPKRMGFVALAGLFAAFYVWYSFRFKTVGLNLESLYLAFRTDFGRDDVTKFVLYRELVETRPILQYRGATLLSAVLFFVPRSIWPGKPYPHYRYLTAALFGTSVLALPSGMTPSIFETSIANFGVGLGIIATGATLLGVCILADRCNSVPRRALYLILLAALLTQSLDAIGSVLALLILGALPRMAAVAMRRRVL